MKFFSRLIRKHRAPRAKARPRRVTVDLAKVTAEAWGEELTLAEARQRIADQAARMHGAGGLFDAGLR